MGRPKKSESSGAVAVLEPPRSETSLQVSGILSVNLTEAKKKYSPQEEGKLYWFGVVESAPLYSVVEGGQCFQRSRLEIKVDEKSGHQKEKTMPGMFAELKPRQIQKILTDVAARIVNKQKLIEHIG